MLQNLLLVTKALAGGGWKDLLWLFVSRSFSFMVVEPSLFLEVGALCAQ